MSEIAFKIQELDSITKAICDLCGLDMGTRAETSDGSSLYICTYCKKSHKPSNL